MINLENVYYIYSTRFQKVEAVKNISCELENGKLYAITGESGSGKSTLLSLIAGLDLPSSGNVFFNGINYRDLDRNLLRKQEVSVVYQKFYLFPLLTALENVMFPLQILNFPNAEAKKRALKCLIDVGLTEDDYHKYPKQMSGGEQQRVAIARAIVKKGKVLLADEPTGNLDSRNEVKIVEILKRLAHQEDYLVVVVTHNKEVAAEADVEIELKDGEKILK